MNDHHAANLIAKALGRARNNPNLRARLTELGGLPGAWIAGPSAFRGALDRPATTRLQAIFELTKALMTTRELAPEIDDAAKVAAYFHPRLALEPTESFWVLMLDSRMRPLATTCIAKGTLNAMLVHPREVFAPAIRARAASVILVHNHPSGDPTPSDEDEALTERLTEVGELLGIPVIDHLIIATGGHRSIRYDALSPGGGREYIPKEGESTLLLDEHHHASTSR